jgi:WD40 repeat protein/energy-coupling factor transporter ATP-binding protein EcfA2
MTEQKSIFNPFPGLRPYNYQEGKYFFGRDSQINGVISKLLNQKFVAVIGSSGSGKSSLINAGILPGICENPKNGAPSSWRTIISRPGESPLDNIAKAIAKTIDIEEVDTVEEFKEAEEVEVLETGEELETLEAAEEEEKIEEVQKVEKVEDDKNTLVKNIAAILRKSPEGLSNVLGEIRADKNEKILLVIDQFEDLFKFKRSKNNKTIVPEHDKYIDLLVESLNNSAVPVYLIVAIRSDFIDECQEFDELNNLINASNLILPQMSKEELSDVINRPAMEAGFEIDRDLESRILTDLNNRTDRLPLLQHLLNRMFENWRGRQDYKRPLTLVDYEAVGGLDNAISLHADLIWEELPDQGKHLCAKLFKAITEKGTGAQEITIPASVGDLAYITRASVTEVKRVVEKFTHPSCPFLVAAKEESLDADSVIDLTHESLMRIWPRLKTWIDEETESVNMYLKLAEASRLYQRGQGGLWTSPKLEQAVTWYEVNEPSFQWSQRYNTAFERTMQFLNKSKEEHYLNEEEIYESSHRKVRNTRIFAGFLIFLVAMSVIGALYISGVISTEMFQQERTTQNDSAPIVPIPAPADQSSLSDEENLPDLEQDGGIQAREEQTDSFELSPFDQFSDNQNQISETVIPAPDVQRQTPVPSADTQRQFSPTVAGTQLRNPENTVPQNENQRPVDENQLTATDIQRQLAENRRLLDQRLSEREPLAEPSTAPVQRASPPAEISSEVTEETVKRRILAAAQTLAVRSLQVEGDPELKALLALQSHVFNEQYNNTAFNSDIYAGLITSVNSLYGNNHNVYKGHTESVNSLVFRPNSTIFYSASSDGTVLQWDINDETNRPRRLINSSSVNNQLAISDNAQFLAVATDGQGVLIFNPSSSNPSPLQVNWGNNRVIAIDFHPDNEHIIFAGSDNSLVRHNIRSNSSEVIATTDSEIMSVAVSHNGNMIAAGTRSGQVILFRDGSTPARQILYTDQGNDILSVKFNQNSSRIAAGTLRGEIRILQISNSSLIATLRGHSARVVDMQFCPTGKFIASSSFDGTVHLWDALNLSSLPVVLRDHGSWVRTVAFNSSGTRMVTGSRHETRLIAWNVNTHEMASMICDKITRTITRAEWDRYIGEDIPYVEACLQLSNR